MTLSASGSWVNPVPFQPSFWPWLWLCCGSIRCLLKHTHGNQFVFRMIHWEGDKFSLFSFTRVNWSFKRHGKSKLYTIVYARFCLFCCFLDVLLLWGFCGGNQTWLLQCPVDFMYFIRSKQADKIWFISGHLGSFLATSLHQGCPRNFVEKMFLTLNSRLTRLQNDIPKWLVAASSFGHV